MMISYLILLVKTICGRIGVKGGVGHISMPDAYKTWAEPLAVERMTIRHLSDNTYLLITPWGHVDLHMEREGERIRGDAGVTSTRKWVFETLSGGP